jgi:hypothetical protein
MNHDQTHEFELIELGCASRDTLGNDIYTFEIGGFMPKHGMSRD